MTANQAFDASCYDAHVTGYTDIRIAVPYDQAAIGLGFCEDQIRPTEELLTNKIYADIQGGQNGTPIEIQDFGEIHRVQFSLTVWNQTAVDLLKTRGVRGTRTDSADGGVTAGSSIATSDTYRPGLIPASRIGDLMMVNRSTRLLLNSATLENVRNYWCAIPEQPIEYNMGTKAQEIQFGFICYPAPCGHRKAGILYDTYSLNAYDDYQIGEAVPTGANS